MSKELKERIAGVAEWLRANCGASAEMEIPGFGKIVVLASGEWSRK